MNTSIPYCKHSPTEKRKSQKVGINVIWKNVRVKFRVTYLGSKVKLYDFGYRIFGLAEYELNE